MAMTFAKRRVAFVGSYKVPVFVRATSAGYDCVVDESHDYERPEFRRAYGTGETADDAIRSYADHARQLIDRYMRGLDD